MAITHNLSGIVIPGRWPHTTVLLTLGQVREQNEKTEQQEKVKAIDCSQEPTPSTGELAVVSEVNDLSRA